MRLRNEPRSLIVFAIVASIAIGCGGAPKHVPATISAQKALETSLAAWKDGKPVGQVAPSGPAINAEDGEWRANKKLKSFAIVGEEPNPAPDTPRKFKVKLTLDGAAAADAVFVVFGNDPIFVYRDKDYELHFGKM